MKNYKRRLKVMVILLIIYGISLLGSIAMVQVVSPMLSQAEKVNLGLSEGNLGIGTMIGLITAGIYLIAGISGIRVSKGAGNGKVCWIAAIALVVILTIDVVAAVYQMILISIATVGAVTDPTSLAIVKRMSQFVVKMIILAIYFKAVGKLVKNRSC